MYFLTIIIRIIIINELYSPLKENLSKVLNSKMTMKIVGI